MLFHPCKVLLFAVFASASTQPSQQDGLLSSFCCGAVNFLATAFLPKPHVTAFCSAYLQIPEQTSRQTVTATGNAVIITKTDSKIVPILTRTVSTTSTATSTTTLDLWTGRPACTEVPKFGWIREYRQRQIPSDTPGFLEQACSCLDIPMSTETVVMEFTTTPTSTFTAGITGSTEITVTETQVATETRTKVIFLVDSETKAPTKSPLSDSVRAASPTTSRLESGQRNVSSAMDINGAALFSIQPHSVFGK